MYLELNAFPDQISNPGPFDLEPIALTVIPPCISLKISFFFRQPSSGIASFVRTVDTVTHHSCLGEALLSCLRAGTAWGFIHKQYGVYFVRHPLPGFEPGSPRPLSKSDDLDRWAMGPASEN